MAQQLIFDLPARPALGREDFFVSPSNANAVALISEDSSWPNGKLALAGPAGSGKSHLAHVWAAESGARIVQAAEVSFADVPSLADDGRIAIEDLENLGGRAGEEALLHLHNLILERDGRILMTGLRPPAVWRIELPDLQSRVQGTTVVQLRPPDDSLLAAVLVKLFADRQVTVSPDLIRYLVARIDRSFDAARDVVDHLDRAALAAGKPLTSRFAAQILDKRSSGAA